jgi:hypothetical protein
LIYLQCASNIWSGKSALHVLFYCFIASVRLHILEFKTEPLKPLCKLMFFRLATGQGHLTRVQGWWWDNWTDFWWWGKKTHWKYIGIIMIIFCRRRWGSSFLGLLTIDPPLSPHWHHVLDNILGLDDRIVLIFSSSW